MKRIALTVIVGIALTAMGLGSFASRAEAGNWPQWRGPDGSGISTEKNLPSEWSPTKNIKWKTPIDGRAHSSPIVWGNKVFVTTAVEGVVVPGAKAVKHTGEDGKEFLHPDSVGADKKQMFKVVCLDRDTGKVLWQSTAWEGTPYDNRHRKSSYAASTPATDGKLGTVGMGTGTSPILFNDLVIVQCDEENGDASFIVAVDKKTGKEAWRTPRKVQVSWSTPLLVRTATRSELITSGTEAVIAYDPATGKELWRHKGLESNAVPTPVVSNDLVVLTSGSPNKIALALRAGGSGDVTGTSQLVWSYNKGTAYVPSPILYGEYLYLMTTQRGANLCGAAQYRHPQKSGKSIRPT